MRRTLMLLSTMVVALLLAGGVALAADITCPGDLCTGTEQNDRITGSQEFDDIQALGGRDVVSARSGDDDVDGGRGSDDIFGGLGGDELHGGLGPDDIDGGRGTTDASPPPVYPDGNTFICTINNRTNTGFQRLLGDDGNDDLDGGRDNDQLVGGAGTNDLSSKGGDDCLVPRGGDANERASGGDGNDLIFSDDGIADDIFCGAGIDSVAPDAEDRVAANCEVVLPPSPPPLQAPGSTPVVEVTSTTEEGTITMTP